MTRRGWREAWRYVLPFGVVGAALLGRRRRSGWLAIAMASLFALFFRDPERPLEADPSVVYAAADGVVTGIEDAVAEPWLPGGSGLRITTFLGLHNVHVNRSPVAGVLTEVESMPGRFAPAMLRRAGDNTRRRLAIDGAAGRVVVIQVAGMVARKITSWVHAGEPVAAGQRLGIIHLGSRTDVLLPVGSAEVLVSTGQRVRAGRTPLARYRRAPRD